MDRPGNEASWQLANYSRPLFKAGYVFTYEIILYQNNGKGSLLIWFVGSLLAWDLASIQAD